MFIEPIQMKWRIGPTTGRLAYATGLQFSSLTKRMSNLRFCEITPGSGLVDQEAVYYLPGDTYFVGRRDREQVYFYVSPSGAIECLTESEFLDDAYKRFESCSVIPPTDPKKLDSLDEEETETEESEVESLGEFSNPSKWNMKPDTCTYWRHTAQHCRAVIVRAAGYWTATVLFPKGQSHKGTPRRTLQEAKVDAWQASLDLDLDGWPVCTKCGSQEFNRHGCINRCGFHILGLFPLCLCCKDDLVFDPRMSICTNCRSCYRQVMAD